MKLSEYIEAERGNAARLSAALGVGISYISQLASGHRTASPARAVQIEVLTQAQVSRRELRPDWSLIWPEPQARAGAKTRSATTLKRAKPAQATVARRVSKRVSQNADKHLGKRGGVHVDKDIDKHVDGLIGAATEVGHA